MGQMPVEARNLKFELGEVVVTPAASQALDDHGHLVDDLLTRHQNGDWGDVSDQARLINERGLNENFNVQSTYVLATGLKLVVVTNGPRTLTMIHLDRAI